MQIVGHQFESCAFVMLTGNVQKHHVSVIKTYCSIYSIYVIVVANQQYQSPYLKVLSNCQFRMHSIDTLSCDFTVDELVCILVHSQA